MPLHAASPSMGERFALAIPLSAWEKWISPELKSEIMPRY